jgi:hypothetical protein
MESLTKTNVTANSRRQFILYCSLAGFISAWAISGFLVAENIKSIATKESLPLHVKQLDVTDDMHLSLLVLSSWLSFSDDNKNLRPVLIY